MKTTLTILMMLACGLRAEHDAVLRVSAAASLANVLDRINAFYRESGGSRVLLNLGASSALARQIEEGAPADVFISADLAKMDGLERKGLIDKSTCESQLSNSLVVIVRTESNINLACGGDLMRLNRIALADPLAVPAGIYAKAWLEKIGVWPQIQTRIVSTENVRAALAAVESGNLDAGVVYKTDAMISKKVKVSFEVPASEAPQITYPMAVVKDSKRATEAKRYLDFLDSSIALKCFQDHGFIVIPEKR